MSFCFIILAGGKSHRFKSNIPKPYQKIGGKSLVEINLNKASKVKKIKKILVVYNKRDFKRLKSLKIKKVKFLKGGHTRQESTFKALRFLKNTSSIKKVLIHDVARPNFSLKLINLIIKNMSNNKAVIPVLKVDDAIKQVSASNIKKTIFNRSKKNVFFTQTPQCYNLKEIYNLHKLSKKKYHDDDLSFFSNLKKIKLINGEKENFKITDLSDFEKLKKIYKSNLKVGIGFDVHRLVSKKKLFLGGLRIKSKLGTLGHSDGDPILHALIDSFLGAAGMKDIGYLFPDKSNKYKNIRSTLLIKDVLNKISLKGFFINNIDINVITQTPKIKNIRNKIKKNIAKICKISLDKINLKGKTTEKLGIIGKEKAIACEVISSIIKYE